MIENKHQSQHINNKHIWIFFQRRHILEAASCSVYRASMNINFNIFLRFILKKDGKGFYDSPILLFCCHTSLSTGFMVVNSLVHWMQRAFLSWKWTQEWELRKVFDLIFIARRNHPCRCSATLWLRRWLGDKSFFYVVDKLILHNLQLFFRKLQNIKYFHTWGVCMMKSIKTRKFLL